MQIIIRGTLGAPQGCKISPGRALWLPRRLIFDYWHHFGSGNVYQKCFWSVINIKMYSRSTLEVPYEHPGRTKGCPKSLSGVSQEFLRGTPGALREIMGSVYTIESSLWCCYSWWVRRTWGWNGGCVWGRRGWGIFFYEFHDLKIQIMPNLKNSIFDVPPPP